VLPEIVAGIITQWSGTIVSIPSGWALCDGSQGTPDMRDKFVVGAGSTYNPTDSAGAVNHDHSFTGDDHLHTMAAGTDISAGIGFGAGIALAPAAGTTDPGSNLPTYYSLAYIMKL